MTGWDVTMQELEPILAFNFAPAVYIDGSWLSALPNSQVVEFLQSHAATSYASQHILEAYGLRGQHDLDFARIEKKLALASRKELTPIVFHAGLALNGPLIKGIIKRQERQAVVSCLGLAGYDYGIKRGPFLAGALVQQFDSGFVIDWNNPEELKKHIFRTGVRLLGAVFGNEPDAFQKRLLFKFPMPSKDYFYGGSAAGYSSDTVHQGGIMLRKLMKEFIQ